MMFTWSGNGVLEEKRRISCQLTGSLFIFVSLFTYLYHFFSGFIEMWKQVMFRGLLFFRVIKLKSWKEFQGPGLVQSFNVFCLAHRVYFQKQYDQAASLHDHSTSSFAPIVYMILQAFILTDWPLQTLEFLIQIILPFHFTVTGTETLED